jgi:hypothetical protein
MMKFLIVLLKTHKEIKQGSCIIGDESSCSATRELVHVSHLISPNFLLFCFLSMCVTIG